MIPQLLRQYRAAYSGLPRNVWFLCAVTLANRMGSMVVPFMALYLTKELHFSVATAGKTLSLFGMGALIGGYLGGWLSTKFRPTWVQAVTLSLEAATLWAFSTFNNLYSIGAGLFLVGLFSESFRPANATAMTNTCPPKLRARGFALNRLAINLGMSIGPAIGGILATQDYHWLFYVDGATCFVAALFVIALFHRAEPSLAEEENPHETATFSACFADKTFLLVSALFLIGLIVFFQFENTYLIYLKDFYGLIESRLGILYAFNTVLIIGVEMVLIHKLEHLNKLSLIAVGFLLICLGFGITPFGSAFSFAAMAMVIITFGEMLAFPTAGAWIAERSTPRNRGLYMGIYSSTFGLATTAAPLIGMQLYAINPDVFWYGTLMLGGVLFTGFSFLARQEKTAK